MGKPKVLVFDIETTPLRSWTWGIWQQDVVRVDEDWGILCFAYKWHGERDVTVVARPDFEGYQYNRADDRAVVEELWNLFNEADVLLAHNGDKFDIKKAKTRFLSHGFPPPSPSSSIDTLRMARRHFAFTSNRLNDLGQALGVGKKVPTGGFDLWLGCMEGDENSWKLMKKYCAQDVRLLDSVYEALLPWGDGGPNMALLSGNLNTCPKCGGELTRRGLRHTATMTYQRYQCKDCLGYSRSRTSEKVGKPLAV